MLGTSGTVSSSIPLKPMKWASIILLRDSYQNYTRKIFYLEDVSEKLAWDVEKELKNEVDKVLEKTFRLRTDHWCEVFCRTTRLAPRTLDL